MNLFKLLLFNVFHRAYGKDLKCLLRETAVREYMYGENHKDMTKEIYQPGGLRKIQVSA